MVRVRVFKVSDGRDEAGKIVEGPGDLEVLEKGTCQQKELGQKSLILVLGTQPWKSMAMPKWRSNLDKAGGVRSSG